MKKQWLGDDHDVRKYCLLKFLSDILGTGIAINWMLTKAELNDNVPSVPESYTDLTNAIKDYRRDHDTRSFDNIKTVLRFEHFPFDKPIEIPNIENPNKKLKRDEYQNKRNEWLNRFLDDKRINQNSLVFFDPNNGIEISSLKGSKCRKESPNYVFYDEIQQAIKKNNVKGVLIYQHALLFATCEKQEEAVRDKCKKLKDKTTITPLYFLGGQEDNYFKEAFILLMNNANELEKIKNAFGCSFNRFNNLLSLKEYQDN